MWITKPTKAGHLPTIKWEVASSFNPRWVLTRGSMVRARYFPDDWDNWNPVIP